MRILEKIRGIEDFKALEDGVMGDLAEEIRTRLIEVTARQGGHIGPNLGVVELTMALHRVFDFREDKITFDVAHQGYVHKLLTGRNGEGFDKLRANGGVSGFLSRDESEFDDYGAGHAGTALSAALGMAKGRDLRGGDEHVVSVIGDAALTCGITMEALNNVATTTKRLVVILNDNEWSIAKNVGAIARYLNELITNPVYNRLHKDLKEFLGKVAGGECLKKFGSKVKQETKDFFVPSSLFEKYGLRYIGPIDGHNLEELEEYLEFTKRSEQPVLLHVLTKKGKGYDVAISNPEKFHGTGPYKMETGESLSGESSGGPKYESVFGAAMVRFGREDKRILGITAAMPSGTGLVQMAKALPEQFFDVGIAEEHAVLFAAGLATEGMIPVCAIYSTFLQRGFDPIVHDVCLQNLNVKFCMDRAGLSPNDGPTHHGLFDIGYLRSIPRVTLMQPKDENELVNMLWTSLKTEGPMFVRYPRGASVGVKMDEEAKILEIGKAELMRAGVDGYIWALGPMVYEMMEIAEEIEREEGISLGVVNARFVKPLDKELLYSQAMRVKKLFTVEDHVVKGGFGTAVLEALNEGGFGIGVERMGWPDEFIGHGSSVEDLRERYGFGREDIKKNIISKMSGANKVLTYR